MHFRAHGFQLLLVGDAEVLLLINDHKREIAELDALAQHRMGAHDNVDIAGGEPIAGDLHVGGAHHARHLRDLDGQALEALPEVAIVLAREQRGGHDDRDLLAIDGRDKGRAQGHFRLAETHIAADQPVHGTARGQIVEGGVDGVLLIFRLVIGEARAELFIKAFRGHKARRLAQMAFGGDLDEAMGHFKNALLHLGAAALPACAA